MKISKKVWNKYIKNLHMLNEEAANMITAYVAAHDVDSEEGMAALIAYSFAIATKYGEGAAALSAQMYDAIATASGKHLPPAVPAQTASYNTTARTVQGARLFSKEPQVVGSAIGRLVKQVGADTTLQNAIRDGAEFAWIPSGDTCAFCLALASRGWQRARKKTLNGGHAEHIHNNCDCAYAIRFDGDSDVEGYDHEKYYNWYKSEPGTPDQKINAM